MFVKSIVGVTKVHIDCVVVYFLFDYLKFYSV